MQDSAYYTDFQALLLRLSTEFINLPSQEFDQRISEVLSLIGRYVEVDHCYIALFTDRELSKTTIVHEWNAPQVNRISSLWTGDMSQWFLDELKGLKVISVARVEDLPPEAASYSEVLQFYDVKSCLDLPLVKDGRLFGMIGYEKSRGFCEWPPETIALLKVVGEIYVNAYERRQIESELVEKERLQSALQKEKESSALRANLMSTVSHEFRAPLAIIKMAVDMLGRFIEPPDEKSREYLVRIDRQVARLDRLLTEFMLAVQSERGYLKFNPQQLDLAQLCQEIVDEVQKTIGIDHHMRLIVHTHFEKFNGDAELLQHILTNLLENAVKYSPPTGKIWLELSSASTEALITVRDEGIGIPIEDQPQLFAPYYRAGNVGTARGSGLGLNIVKSCVDLHGGRITFEMYSRAGQSFLRLFASG